MRSNEQTELNDERCESSSDRQTVLEHRTRAKFDIPASLSDKQIGENRELLPEYEEFVERQVAHTRRTYQKRRAAIELNYDFVQWDQINGEETASFVNLLNSNCDEPSIHEFLKENPKFLVQTLGGGHGRYTVSKKRLGSEYVTDFVIADENSMGVHWYAVELESPRAKPHRKDGLQTQELTHALGQIRDWRRWLKNNLDYARRSREQDGLGLIGIDPNVTGLIIIGRRNNYHERYNEFRREMIDDSRIVIHSYDWLIDLAYSNRSGMLSMELL